MRLDKGRLIREIPPALLFILLLWLGLRSNHVRVTKVLTESERAPVTTSFDEVIKSHDHVLVDSISHCCGDQGCKSLPWNQYNHQENTIKVAVDKILCNNHPIAQYTNGECIADDIGPTILRSPEDIEEFINSNPLSVVGQFSCKECHEWCPIEIFMAIAQIEENVAFGAYLTSEKADDTVVIYRLKDDSLEHTEAFIIEDPIKTQNWIRSHIHTKFHFVYVTLAVLGVSSDILLRRTVGTSKYLAFVRSSVILVALSLFLYPLLSLIITFLIQLILFGLLPWALFSGDGLVMRRFMATPVSANAGPECIDLCRYVSRDAMAPFILSASVFSCLLWNFGWIIENNLLARVVLLVWPIIHSVNTRMHRQQHEAHISTSSSKLLVFLDVMSLLCIISFVDGSLFTSFFLIMAALDSVVIFRMRGGGSDPSAWWWGSFDFGAAMAVHWMVFGSQLGLYVLGLSGFVAMLRQIDWEKVLPNRSSEIEWISSIWRDLEGPTVTHFLNATGETRPVSLGQITMGGAAFGGLIFVILLVFIDSLFPLPWYALVWLVGLVIPVTDWPSSRVWERKLRGFSVGSLIALYSLNLPPLSMYIIVFGTILLIWIAVLKPIIGKFDPTLVPIMSRLSKAFWAAYIVQVGETDMSLSTQFWRSFRHGGISGSVIRLVYTGQVDAVTAYGIAVLLYPYYSRLFDMLSPHHSPHKSTEKPFKQRKAGKSERSCRICFDGPVSHLVLPCGHYAFCEACANRLRGDQCPFCGDVVSSFVRAYDVQ